MIDDHRHLDISKGPRAMVGLLCLWSTNPGGGGGLSFAVAIKSSDNHYFCTCLSYLLREVVLSREVVSVIPKLQVRLL